AYLENLGSSRHEVLNTFQKTPSASTQTAINAEYLKITAEEYLILTGKGFDSQVVSPAVPLFNYYGLPNSNLSPLSKVPEFLSRTGIAYADLVELIKTKFFNPNYPQGAALTFFLKIPISFAALTALKNSNFPSNPAPEILSALQQAGITMAELQSWSNANYQALSKLIVLDSPNSVCDLRLTTLQHLDGTPLTSVEFSKLHRFIRLWRKLGWSIADFDRALAALNATDITPAAINQLAEIRQLQSELNIPKLQVLLSLWSPVNTRGADALYSKLFLNKAALRIDSAFAPSATDGSVLTTAGLRISDHVPALLSALRVSEADLNAIRSDAQLLDTPPDNPSTFAALTLANVSLLYRYAALAKALKLRVTDFISLKTLTGINPFAAPAQTRQFVTAAQKVKRAGVKVATLDYLYRHEEAAPVRFAPQQSEILLLAKSLRDGLTTIAQDNVAAPDPLGNLTRAKLGLLFESSIVDQAVTMINGTTVYAAPLATLPITIAKVDQAVITGIDPAKLPETVASKTAYDPATHQLSFQGAMTTAEKTALLGASADGPYQTAVNDLFQQPATFLQNALSGFLTGPNVEQDLLRSVPSLDKDLKPVLLDAGGNPTTNEESAVTTAIAAKFAHVLNALLPYLRDQLSHAFVRQTIADALKLTSAQAKLLLETALRSQAGTSAAIIDLLALATHGLSANYFTSDSLAGNSTAETTQGTAVPPGKLSARWTGMLLALNNGEFTFSVKTTGGVQLWVDDDTQPLAMQLEGAAKEYVSTEKISLKAGQLYNLRLDVTQLPAQGALVELRWHSATTPKAIIPAGNLYPRSVLDAMGSTYTRLQKSVILVNMFELSEEELGYIQAPANSAAFGGFDLNSLPLARDPANAAQVQQLDDAAPVLFASWLRVYDFVTLRNSLPSSETSLIDVFSALS
ncbi:MAG TPA: PA14 domain-containing protein, partial [Blastocatellia bacterium]